MAEYSRLASGTVTSVLTSAPTSVVLPFVPNFIEIYNSTRAAAASGVTRAWWTTNMGQGAAFLVTTAAGPADGTSFISSATGGGFSTFQGGTALQFGPLLSISGITKASPAVVTTTAAHGLVSGNVVMFQGLFQSSTTGMPQICGMPFVVTVTGATTFTIPWNTNQSNYTALSGSPSGAFVKKLSFPNLYAPGVGFISALTLSSTTTVTTTSPTNFQVGQEVAFRIPSTWGTVELNSLPNTSIPGSPIYGYVTSVSSSTAFVVNIVSTGYTAFNSNPSVASVQGLTFPQVVAVGDNNSGSNQFGYNSPAFFNGTGTAVVNSINGPALAGSFSNNTSMGFTIGGSISGTTADSIFWRAYLHDVNFT